MKTRIAIVLALVCAFSQTQASHMAELAKCTPDNASLFVVIRPQQFLNSTTGRQMSDAAASKDVDLSSVEFVAAAVSLDTLGKNITTAKMSGQDKKEVLKNATIPRMATLVSFTNSNAVDRLQNMSLKDGDTSFLRHGWNGRDVLISKTHGLKAIRLDERTILVVDKHCTAPNANPRKHKNMWTALSTERSADFAIAINVEQAAMENSVPTDQLQGLKLVTMSVGVSAGDLLKSNLSFSTAKAAAELPNTIMGFRQLALMQLGSMSQQGAPEQRQLMNALTGLVKSLQVQAAGTDVSIRLPRPANFEELMSDLANSAMQLQESR